MAKRWIGWHRRRVSVNRVWPSEWKRPVFTHSVCVSRTPRLANHFKSNELGIASNGMSDALLYASLQRIWYKSGCGSLLNPTLYLLKFIGCLVGFFNLGHPLFLLTPSDRTIYPLYLLKIFSHSVSSVFSEIIEMNFYQKKIVWFFLWLFLNQRSSLLAKFLKK